MLLKKQASKCEDVNKIILSKIELNYLRLPYIYLEPLHINLFAPKVHLFLVSFTELMIASTAYILSFNFNFAAAFSV